VLGWGGLAYLERRRRAAESGPADGRSDADSGIAEAGAAGPRIGRAGILGAALVFSALALAVSLMPFDGSGSGGTVARDASGAGQPVADPGPSFPTAGPLPSSPTASTRPSATSTRSATRPDPGTQDKSSAPARRTPRPAVPAKSPAAATCRVTYKIAGQWPDGFEAAVTVTSDTALDTWRLGWTYRDGQRITQMWDATYVQRGSHVTATARDYNKSVSAGGTFSFGFLGSWHDGNSAARDFTLNGRGCTAGG
jgi:hypothetical protein